MKKKCEPAKPIAVLLKLVVAKTSGLGCPARGRSNQIDRATSPTSERDQKKDQKHASDPKLASE